MKTEFRFALAIGCAALAAAASPAFAQEEEPSAERLRQVIVYGTDPCPPSLGEEVVVCARRPETERYRVPEPLRDTGAKGESWTARARQLEYVGETGIQSCSTVGPGGQTGCLEELLRRWREERREQAAAEAKLP